MGFGGSSSAADAAQAAEAARLAARDKADKAINAAYDSPQRKKQISNYVDALRTFYGDDLSRQKAINDRQLTFALARNGQIGGSTQVDQSAKLGQDYARGLLQVTQQAQGAGANLEGADQAAKANLESLANQGLDATTAAQDAAAAQQSAIQTGRSTAMAQGLGDVYGNAQDFYTKSQDLAGQNSINNPFSAGQFSSNFQMQPIGSTFGAQAPQQATALPPGF